MKLKYFKLKNKLITIKLESNCRTYGILDANEAYFVMCFEESTGVPRRLKRHVHSRNGSERN